MEKDELKSMIMEALQDVFKEKEEAPFDMAAAMYPDMVKKLAKNNNLSDAYHDPRIDKLYTSDDIRAEVERLRDLKHEAIQKEYADNVPASSELQKQYLADYQHLIMRSDDPAKTTAELLARLQDDIQKERVQRLWYPSKGEPTPEEIEAARESLKGKALQAELEQWVKDHGSLNGLAEMRRQREEDARQVQEKLDREAEEWQMQQKERQDLLATQMNMNNPFIGKK
jgi:hypothetical protein